MATLMIPDSGVPADGASRFATVTTVKNLGTSPTTISVSTTEFVGASSIVYIRPINLYVNLTGARPNTELHVYFDTELVDNIIVPVDVDTRNPSLVPTLTSSQINSAGTQPLVSDDNGNASFFIIIPSGRFTTGSKEITITETTDLAKYNILGNLLGKANAIFTSKGTLETYQTTTVNTTTIIRLIPPPPPQTRDPLAQSFFTYGVEDGLYLTSIDLFFESKDANIPVRVELRRLINGFPENTFQENQDLVAYVNPSNVNISSDSSASTRFTFNHPIYLSPDSDYCFVVVSNSNNYSVWTSRMGEPSVETGVSIFKQPYVGSLFKSENNKTWTAEQFEDIKFKLNVANFDTTKGRDVTFFASSPRNTVFGSSFITTSGSRTIAYKSPRYHGLEIGNRIRISGSVGSFYNGIPSADFSGTFTITRVIDEYIVEYECNAEATSSGPVLSCGSVTSIVIENAGTNYTSIPTLTISAPDEVGGVQATATVSVVDGKITAVNVVNSGSGYTKKPVVSITGGGGSGASLVGIIDAVLIVTVNKIVHKIIPQIKQYKPSSTSIDSTITSIFKNYQGGSLTSYTFDNNHLFYVDRETKFQNQHMIASPFNEELLLGNQSSLKVRANFNSNNSNVSPLIDMRANPTLLAVSNLINDQANYEDITSTNASGQITGFTQLMGGSGYTVAPSVTVVPAYNDYTGGGAVVTATLGTGGTAGQVVSLTIVDPGLGYTQTPTIVIAPPPTGTTATAQAVINPFNSEINTVGTALSRYLTKRITLKTVSSDLHVFSYAYSSEQTSFDWYIRTSLSANNQNHEMQPWVLMKCDTKRNKSVDFVDFYDYEFYTEGVEPFDTYDLKCVLSSSNPTITPFIKQYRVIAVV